MSTVPREQVGILNLQKPSGWTSHDVVARVRRLAGQKRVGHAGTLDPLARGVLPVLLGRATRLAELVQLGSKTYVATIRFGTATDTDDAAGRAIAEAPVPALAPDTLAAALRDFRGEIAQIPPQYSAVQVAGQRAYAVARRGGQLDLQPRRVTVYDLHVLAHAADHVELEVTCSRGTYIRALARDLARRLGSVGHLAALVRTRVGPFCLTDAVTLEQLAERGVAACLLSPDQALPQAPRVHLGADAARALRNGQSVASDLAPSAAVWAFDEAGHLLCLASADSAWLRPRVALGAC